MSRAMSAEMLAALAEGHVSLAMLFEGTFKGGDVNIWTGIGPLVWDGKTWTGAGTLLGVSPVEETTEVKAAGINVSLSGVSSSQIALALAEMQRRAPGVIYLALMTVDTNEIVPDPVVWFRGQLDACVIEDGTENATIRVSYENELITLENSREIRYTSEEQKRLYPGDLGCDYIAGLQDAQLHWGQRE